MQLQHNFVLCQLELVSRHFQVNFEKIQILPKNFTKTGFSTKYCKIVKSIYQGSNVGICARCSFFSFTGNFNFEDCCLFTLWSQKKFENSSRKYFSNFSTWCRLNVFKNSKNDLFEISLLFSAKNDRS